jgi:hypothetical protein
MKGNLIAAGGVFVAALAVVGLAGPATADSGTCDLTDSHATSTLTIDRNGIYAGRQRSCSSESSSQSSSQSSNWGDDIHDNGDDTGNGNAAV